MWGIYGILENIFYLPLNVEIQILNINKDLIYTCSYQSKCTPWENLLSIGQFFTVTQVTIDFHIIQSISRMYPSF